MHFKHKQQTHFYSDAATDTFHKDRVIYCIVFNADLIYKKAHFTSLCVQHTTTHRAAAHFLQQMCQIDQNNRIIQFLYEKVLVPLLLLWTSCFF